VADADDATVDDDTVGDADAEPVGDGSEVSEEDALGVGVGVGVEADALGVGVGVEVDALGVGVGVEADALGVGDVVLDCDEDGDGDDGDVDCLADDVGAGEG
jgi:hypothetical protein